VIAIAALVISILAIGVSGCQVYWTLRLRNANRRLAAIRAEQEAMPQPIIKVNGMLTPQVNDEVLARIRKRLAGARPPFRD
jgi:hypothetical protein